MTKDYKKVDKEEASGGYGWMLSGIALGLLIGLGMYFYANYKHPAVATETVDGAINESGVPFGGSTETSDIQEPDPISVVIESARQEQQDKKRATFSYYAVLPNLELDINVKPSEKDSKIETEATEKVVLKPGSYILQIASFKSEEQARGAQRKLLKRGLETHIEKRLVKGSNWYRVFAGPTEQSANIDEWQALVMKSGFKPLIVNIK